MNWESVYGSAPLWVMFAEGRLKLTGVGAAGMNPLLLTAGWPHSGNHRNF
jgi:hypothetical protein